MAGIVERLKKKTKQSSDWSTSGSFMNKPARGWLHPDDQLSQDTGVVYGVRYIGNMEVKQSMKSLDFETRTAVAKESISRVCDAGGLKTATKRNKRAAKIHKLLGDEPNLLFAGTNVNLTITTESLAIMNMENGEMLGNHLMPGISFASGGDPDTMDFVAYVAKDEMFGRACHVLECGGGMAQEVITTIGQAFELRYKLFLAHRPEAVSLPDRLENPVFGSNGDAWGEEDEKDYYNDRVGARAPSPPLYSSPPCNLPISDGVYNSVKNPSFAGIGESQRNVTYDNKDAVANSGGIYDNNQRTAGPYDNAAAANSTPVLSQSALFDDIVYDNKEEVSSAKVVHQTAAYMPSSVPPPSAPPPPPTPPPTESIPQPLPPRDDVRPKQNGHGSNGVSSSSVQQNSTDCFNMTPFCHTLPPDQFPPTENGNHDNSSHSSSTNSINSPHVEPWFHGKISRTVVETMLLADGDFLVRESIKSAGQYVLSGRQCGKIKHLLLVDPEGAVRTKDRKFDSISHLIKYHMDNNQPITSQDSELILCSPIMHSSG